MSEAALQLEGQHAMPDRHCWREGCRVPSAMLYRCGERWTCNSHDDDPRAREARQAARQRGAERAGQRTRKSLAPDELQMATEEQCHQASVTVAHALGAGRIAAARANALRSLIALALSALRQAHERDALDRVTAALERRVQAGDTATIRQLQRLLRDRRTR